MVIFEYASIGLPDKNSFEPLEVGIKRDKKVEREMLGDSERWIILVG